MKTYKIENLKHCYKIAAIETEEDLIVRDAAIKLLNGLETAGITELNEIQLDQFKFSLIDISEVEDENIDETLHNIIFAK